MTSIQSANRTPALAPKAESELSAALLTGGIDKPYAQGLAFALAAKGVRLDVIGSDAVDSPELRACSGVSFLNLRGDRRAQVSILKKAMRVIHYYGRLLSYAASAKPEVFHILWNNKFQAFDRTLLMLYYRAMGKKIAFTAHNVNAAARDGRDSSLNRLTSRIQYHLADRIFVHTEKMKAELLRDFGVRESAVTVVPFGINNAAPETNLSRSMAKESLGIGRTEKAILFFGAIRPYKGLEYLLEAFERLMAGRGDYRLIIAGQPLRESGGYPEDIQRAIDRSAYRDRILSKFDFIPDEQTELYFKAADVIALPYVQVYQSGVLFLAYRFGLPAVAARVGSFDEDVVEGETGFLFRPCDSADMARALETYFASELYRQLDERRREIRERVGATNSWDAVAEITVRAYSQLLGRNR